MSDYIFLCATDMGIMYDDVHHTILTHEWSLVRIDILKVTAAVRGTMVMASLDTPQHLESAEDDSCDAVIDWCPSQPGVDPVNNFMNSAVCRNQFDSWTIGSYVFPNQRISSSIEPCLYGESDAVFEVQFDSKPDQMEVGACR
jgi:hypothetical protein